jgi:hypothetical protein
MLFIPLRSKQSTTTLSPQYYWQANEQGRQRRFCLYREDVPIAWLSLTSRGRQGAGIVLRKEKYSFQDASSFFGARLQLLSASTGLRMASVEKSTYHPGEGTIQLQAQRYGWKIINRFGNRLMLLDQQRNGLFSYHYSPDAVRLLLTKTGRHHPQLELLLGMALYLLPLWHGDEKGLAG